MRQSTLRLAILTAWGLSFLVCAFALLVSPRFIKEIHDDQAPEAIKQITAVWLPVFSCLVTFWFGQRGSYEQSARRKVDKERAVPAIAITAGYLSIVCVLILWAAYGVDYSRYTSPDLDPRMSFEGRITSCVQLAAMLSPFGTAPAIWLSGGTVGRTHAAEL